MMMLTYKFKPSPRIGHCVATNNDNTKAVIFGGYFKNGYQYQQFYNDLWLVTCSGTY